jgi:hypothetical protein
MVLNTTRSICDDALSPAFAGLTAFDAAFLGFRCRSTPGSILPPASQAENVKLGAGNLGVERRLAPEWGIIKEAPHPGLAASHRIAVRVYFCGFPNKFFNQ